LNARQVEATLRQCAGNLSATARAFGVSRQAVANFVGRRPSLQAVVTEQRETLIDAAESCVFAAVLNGDLSAARYVLGTIGKHRGWVDLASEVEVIRQQLEELLKNGNNTHSHRRKA
jgi:hypothetical protein